VGVSDLHGQVIGPLQVTAKAEAWPLAEVLRITGHSFRHSHVVHVELACGAHRGHGEASGVYFRGDDVPHMLRAIESVRPVLERGISRLALQALLPPGGARNALDAALWDLQACLEGSDVWRLAGLAQPTALCTTYTVGADSPPAMAARAARFAAARAIKLKLTGDGLDAERVRAVRAVVPNAWLGVDANQGLTRDALIDLLPLWHAQRVALVEQPLPIGSEAELEGLDSPIPLAADESVLDRVGMETLVGRFEVVNIKLDKCGGLTEALAMARRARELGLRVMVGNMTGTSLAAAPTFLVGQGCEVVDLDGAFFLVSDRTPGLQYSSDGTIVCPPTVWGRGQRTAAPQHE
jgi:L-Ala-D/L-Glu epimerase